jgi:hypothetical protein
MADGVVRPLVPDVMDHALTAPSQTPDLFDPSSDGRTVNCSSQDLR